ncbi:hypothetical protein [Halobacillus mangrovi]|uniref:hypothetical protein n=1 Tax=Halobacillus mangrovi TaxID=402384 RepID=UPI003D99BD31
MKAEKGIYSLYKFSCNLKKKLKYLFGLEVMNLSVDYSARELEKILLEKGVSESYIDRIKKEQTLRIEEYSIYYDFQKGQKLQYIPVDRIKSLSRVPFNVSWFDLALAPVDVNISSDRLNRCMYHLSKSADLKTYHNFFESDRCRNVNPIEFEYYDKDNIYAASKGNHRSIYAKITNAPYIKAGTVKFIFNQEKYNNYMKLKSAFYQFEKLLNTFCLSYFNNGEYEGLSYKGNEFILASDKSFLNSYFEYKKNNFPFLESVITQNLISDIIDDLQYLTEEIKIINEKSSEYKRFFKFIKWIKVRSIRNWIFSSYHYLLRERDKHLYDSALLITQKDLNFQTKDPIDLIYYY